MEAQSLASQIDEYGFAILPEFLMDDELAAVERSLANLEDRQGVRTRGGVYAIRNLLRLSPEIRALASSKKLRDAVRAALGCREPFAVRGLLFDKIPGANWLVPWHQDLTICVKSRLDVAGYGPWSVKAGVVHVQPPVDVLDRMLAVRIHLDAAGECNGALRVLPGTHRAGRLSADSVASIQASAGAVECHAPRGGAVLMKPLLLHASPAAEDPAHRRVIHLEFACGKLAGGLEWAEVV